MFRGAGHGGFGGGGLEGFGGDMGMGMGMGGGVDDILGMGGMPTMGRTRGMSNASEMPGVPGMPDSGRLGDDESLLEDFIMKSDPLGMHDIQRGAQLVYATIRSDPAKFLRRMQMGYGSSSRGAAIARGVFSLCKKILGQSADGGRMGGGMSDGGMGGEMGAGMGFGGPFSPARGHATKSNQSPFSEPGGRPCPDCGGFHGGRGSRGLPNQSPLGGFGGRPCPDCGGFHGSRGSGGLGAFGGML